MNVNKWVETRKNLRESFLFIFRNDFLLGAFMGLYLGRLVYVSFLENLFQAFLTFLLWTCFHMFTKSERSDGE